MVWSSSATFRGVFGAKKVVAGTWDSTGVTGGDIATGLALCEHMVISHTGTAVNANAAVMNETFPVSGGAITLVTTSGDKGTFFAIGK
jgi:hypothetical protein